MSEELGLLNHYHLDLFNVARSRRERGAENKCGCPL